MERGKVRSSKCFLGKCLPLVGVLWWEKPWSLAISLKMGCRLIRRWKWLMWCVMWLKRWIWEEVATSLRCNFLPTFCFLQLVNKIMSTNFPEGSDVVCNSVWCWCKLRTSSSLTNRRTTLTLLRSNCSKSIWQTSVDASLWWVTIAILWTRWWIIFWFSKAMVW